MDSLVRKVFGSSSEKLDHNQLSLFGLNVENVPGKSNASLNNGEAFSQVALGPVKAKQKPREQGIPDNLPVVEEIIEPEAVKATPENWRVIGQEVSEQLDYTPGRFFKRRLIRRRYVSIQDKELAPIIAELPPKLIERGMIAPGLVTQVVVGKYCDHLPLYRQEKIYRERYKVWLSRQRMSNWMDVAAGWLKPIYRCIRLEVMVGYVQIDETVIKYLDPGNGKTKQGYLWTTNKPGGDVFYHWETGRSAACLDNIIPVDFRGTIQSDGYAGYGRFCSGKEGVTLAACWAHVRRPFFEARETYPTLIGWILWQIRNLYQIEERLREKGVSAKLRQVVRAHEARPIYNRIFKMLESWNLTRNLLPKSGFAEAIRYTLKLKKQLGEYLLDGRIQIDNNGVENAIRPTAVGKRNWLFVGSAEAGETSAILYTIVECCRRRGIDPETYLRDVLTRLPYSTNWQIKDLTPEAWAKAHSDTILKKAA